MKLLECWKPAKYYQRDSGNAKEYPEIEVSFTGKFRYSYNKKPIIPRLDGSYYKIQPYVNQKQVMLLAHLVIASTFLDFPKETGLVVDHIDRNKENFSISNLRFVTQSVNLVNRDCSRKPRYLIRISNNSRTVIEIIKVDFSLRIGDCLTLSDNETLVTVSEDMYFRELRDNPNGILKLIDSGGWVKVGNSLYINRFGQLKITTNKIVLYTYGRLNSRGYYVVSGSFSKYSKLVHRIVARVFLNNDLPIDPDSPIDHIDTDKLNNSVDNLRICNGQQENISNPITLSKMRKKVVVIIGDNKAVFESRKKASEVLMVAPSTVKRWIDDVNVAKTLYPDMKSIYYSTSEEVTEGQQLDFIEKKVRDSISLEEVNKFLLENKITRRKDLIDRGYGIIYERIRYQKWTKLVTYYKPEEGED